MVAEVPVADLVVGDLLLGEVEDVERAPLARDARLQAIAVAGRHEPMGLVRRLLLHSGLEA
jgi:hypothetical protein